MDRGGIIALRGGRSWWGVFFYIIFLLSPGTDWGVVVVGPE